MTAKPTKVHVLWGHKGPAQVFVEGHFSPKHPRVPDVLAAVREHLVMNAGYGGAVDWKCPQLSIGARAWAVWKYYIDETGEFERAGFNTFHERPEGTSFRVTEVRVTSGEK